MDSQRTILVIALLVLSFFMFQQWQLKGGNTPGIDRSSAPTEVSANGQSDVPSDVPAVDGDIPVAGGNGGVPAAETTAVQGDMITVETDVLRVKLSLRGGDLVQAELLQHAETLGEAERYTILYQRPGHLHIAQSGLIGPDGIDNSETRPVFRASQTRFEMNGDRLEVPLYFTKDDGTEIIKRYTFTRGDYAVQVAYDITNHSDAPKTVNFYGQLKQTMVDGGRSSMFMPTYRGAAYSSESNRYKKYSFSDIQDRNFSTNTPAGWVAMLEHYFVTAWVPDQESTNRLYTNRNALGEGMIGFIGPAHTIAPGQNIVLETALYMGPKDQARLRELAQHLNLTVDYGFLWWLAQPIYWLLSLLQSFVVNWGLAIILVTIIVKTLLYPLTKAQYVSMAKMRKIAPKMKEMRERFGDDRQKLSQAMMKMYQEEKVNPLGGCLPMLLQLPIFLALYWVLLESPEIRHADFMLWINDLSSRDPYFILPLLMGASMYLMQRLQPTPVTDPMQAKILQFMPVMFTVFFLFFPAGLVLYWLVSNIISITQMTYIYRQIDKKEALGHKKK
ncbi:membrane protein insertase YidC [Aliidiomarina haloalkalitolerans]|uniref:Membrane protein insertase YidC n=1 Tax=Aliidiomarina haloalkalitolerans TaxID=859059 RepID=A0A432VSE7_9GAMM|nr:membrane protein insertase YidC [Aliidiomarina haloalkalitolerans]RUO19162.1 membrane protein insertase YidC [Aliidiomarina haloalkalitolerans]